MRKVSFFSNKLKSLASKNWFIPQIFHFMTHPSPSITFLTHRDQRNSLAISLPRVSVSSPSKMNSSDGYLNDWQFMLWSNRISRQLLPTLPLTTCSTNHISRDLTVRSEGFCRSLEGKWALGDCGNSIIIFVWQHYKKVRFLLLLVGSAPRKHSLRDPTRFYYCYLLLFL